MSATLPVLSDQTDDGFFALQDAIRSAYEANRDETRAAGDEAGRLIQANAWDEDAYDRTYGAVVSVTSRLDLRLRRGDARYYLILNGITVGWVCAPDSQANGWTTYRASLPTGDGITGRRVSSGSKTRTEAIEEFFVNIAIRGFAA